MLWISFSNNRAAMTNSYTSHIAIGIKVLGILNWLLGTVLLFRYDTRLNDC